MREFHWRFRNWINWCNLKGLHRSKSGSIEGYYNSPQVWESRDPIPQWIKELDHNDAIEVNRVFIYLPEKTRRTIVILYFRPHWRDTWRAQKLNCHVSKLQDRANEARTVLSNALTRQTITSNLTLRETVLAA